MDEQMQTKKGMSGVTITLLILLTAVVFGGGAYAYVNNKATKEKNDLNAQITDLQKQVATSGATATTTTPNSSTSAIDETASWKTYTNDKYGFSFKYPNTYTATDELEKNTISVPERKLSIKSNTSTMDLYVNPDGFGPFFPDVQYAMDYTGGKIKSTKTISSDENSKDSRTLAVGNLTVGSNEYLYFFYMEDSDTQPLTEFDKILTTFKFTQ